MVEAENRARGEMRWRILIAVAVTFVGTSLLWLGGLIGLYLLYFGGEPPFHVTLRHPDVVAVGAEFDLEVVVENAGAEPLQLRSIDLYDSLLDGFELLGADPPGEDSQHTMGFMTLWFARVLAPGEPAVQRIKLRAARPGRHGGQVDVCTPLEVCTTVYASIEVAGAEGS